MSDDHVSPAIEEYLEQIYRLEQSHGVARTTQIAEKVGVELGTVTNTVDALKKRRLVLHEPYKGVKLTESGRRIALLVLRRHRLAERLLTDLLDVDWSRVHDLACRLEHAIPDDLTKFIEKAVGHPRVCPHGSPIPTGCGGVVEKPSIPLSTLDPGSRGVVAKVTEEQQDRLEYLMTLNLVPGTKVTVVEKAPFDGPITVEVNGHRHPISRAIASLIWLTTQGIE
jgi:DtxR family Mn-dependent transcriptional regulator